MPTQITEMPKSNRGRSKKYDFSKTFDGKTWMIVKENEKGEGDFDCEVASIRAHLYREVRDAGLSLKSSETTSEDGRPALAYRTVKPGEEKKDAKSGAKSETKTAAAA